MRGGRIVTVLVAFVAAACVAVGCASLPPPSLSAPQARAGGSGGRPQERAVGRRATRASRRRPAAGRSTSTGACGRRRRRTRRRTPSTSSPRTARPSPTRSPGSSGSGPRRARRASRMRRPTARRSTRPGSASAPPAGGSRAWSSSCRSSTSAPASRWTDIQYLVSGTPYIDATVFPGLTESESSSPGGTDAWSSTPVGGPSGSFQWVVDYSDYFYVADGAMGSAGSVRCVAGPTGPVVANTSPARYAMPGDGTGARHHHPARVAAATVEHDPEPRQRHGHLRVARARRVVVGLALAHDQGARLRPRLREPDLPAPDPSLFKGVGPGYWSSTTMPAFNGDGAIAIAPNGTLGPFAYFNTFTVLCVHPEGGPPCAAPRGSRARRRPTAAAGRATRRASLCEACVANGEGCEENVRCCTGFCAVGEPNPNTCAGAGRRATTARTRPPAAAATATSACATRRRPASTSGRRSAPCRVELLRALGVRDDEQVPVPTCCLPTGTDCSQNTQSCCDQTTCVNGKCT